MDTPRRCCGPCVLELPHPRTGAAAHPEQPDPLSWGVSWGGREPSPGSHGDSLGPALLELLSWAGGRWPPLHKRAGSFPCPWSCVHGCVWSFIVRCPLPTLAPTAPSLSSGQPPPHHITSPPSTTAWGHPVLSRESPPASLTLRLCPWFEVPCTQGILVTMLRASTVRILTHMIYLEV